VSKKKTNDKPKCGPNRLGWHKQHQSIKKIIHHKSNKITYCMIGLSGKALRRSIGALYNSFVLFGS
jgi:hypothetical protein